MSYTITLGTDLPADPITTLELADALPDLIRSLNLVTMHPSSLEYPSEVYRVIQDLALAVQRLPQLTEQLRVRLLAMRETGHVTVDGGRYQGNPGLAVDSALIYLDQASAETGKLRGALEDAARETAHLGWDAGECDHD